MKRIFIDMDGVLCDFRSKFTEELSKDPSQPFPQSKYGFFATLTPIKGAIEAFNYLKCHFDVFILTRPSTKNLNCYADKALWVKNNLGEEILEKLVYACDKSIVEGNYLIDDDTRYGQTKFKGEFIQFGVGRFDTWDKVVDYLMHKEDVEYLLKEAERQEMEEIRLK